MLPERAVVRQFHRNMNVLLIGPSGGGKGTHAVALIKEMNLVHVSMGDLFHHNLEHKSALGLLARNYINRGELVPDEVADAMIEEWLQTVPAANGILFDGFPRTLYQAKFLDEAFQKQGRHLDAVIYLKVSDEVVIARLTGRRICATCSAPYHATFRPPARPNICDLCGGGLYERADDKPEMVRARLRTFHRTIGPVLDHYQKAGRLAILDAEGQPAGVYQAMVSVLRSAQQKELRPATREEVTQLRPYRPDLLPEKAARPSLDLVLLGGPGSGKGTQAEHLCPEFGIPHISTGDLFRDNLRRATELGKMAKAYMDRGELVPDSVTEAMVERRLANQDTQKGFVFDGFPRTLAQAHALDEMLTAMGRRLSGAISIEVSDQEIIDRLSARRICSRCQASYHLTFKPPARAGLCDACGGALCQRDDDNPSTIGARLKTFHAQIQPLADFYNQRGFLVQVNGEGPATEVTMRTIAAAKSLIPKGAGLCSKSLS